MAGRSGLAWAGRLFGFGLRLGTRGSWWAVKQPWRMVKGSGKEFAGAGGVVVAHWAGLVVWFVYGLVLLYAASWARKVGWLTPVGYALSTVGVIFLMALAVFMRTQTLRNNARTRAMMRKMFESTQRTEQRVERVEHAVKQQATGGGFDAFDVFRAAGTEAERMQREMLAEQAGQVRQWTGGAIPLGPDPVIPAPRFVRRFRQGFRHGWGRPR